MNKFLTNFCGATKYLNFFIVPMLISIFLQSELLNLLIPVSIYLGYKRRPEKIWPLWLTAVVSLWVTYGLGTLFRFIPFNEGGETWWSFGFEAFIFMGLLVAIPMFIGRLISRRINK